MTKVCTQCGIEKSLEEFQKRHDRASGYFSMCRVCKAKGSANWKREHPEQARVTSLRSAVIHVYRRLAEDPSYRLQNALAARIRGALKTGGKKAARTVELLGCSLDDFRQHIANQFLPGMTWDNWGDWHLDHKRPCAIFDLTDVQQQKECFHFSNYQPLWAADNIRKGAKIL